MPVDPSPFALTTPEEFLAYIGEPSVLDPNGKQHDRAQRLINAYSRAVNRYIKRQFLPTESAGDKIFPYNGNGYLSLTPFEARAIHTVTLYTDLPEASWVVLANQSPTQEAGFRANPRHKTEQGTYWSLTLPELGEFSPYFDEPITTLSRKNLGFQVTVNADWGVAETEEVPDDVQLALWISVANAWRNPEAYQRRQLGALSAADYESYTPGTEEGLGLPRAARALLSGYKRRTGAR